MSVLNPTALRFLRPADTTAYASGDLVGNSTTAVAVRPLVFEIVRNDAGSAWIAACRLWKSGTSVTSAAFRLHLFRGAPIIATTGDNGVFASVVSGSLTHLGAFDVSSMMGYADGAVGYGSPENGSSIRGIRLTTKMRQVFGLIEARGAYTPASAEAFEASLEIIED